jgi:hypothetical protein
MHHNTTGNVRTGHLRESVAFILFILLAGSVLAYPSVHIVTEGNTWGTTGGNAGSVSRSNPSIPPSTSTITVHAGSNANPFVSGANHAFTTRSYRTVPTGTVPTGSVHVIQGYGPLVYTRAPHSIPAYGFAYGYSHYHNYYPHSSSSHLVRGSDWSNWYAGNGLTCNAGRSICFYRYERCDDGGRWCRVGDPWLRTYSDERLALLGTHAIPVVYASTYTSIPSTSHWEHSRTSYSYPLSTARYGWW